MRRAQRIQASLAILWTALLCTSSRLPSALGKKDDNGRCSNNAVALVMTTCQGQRHKLSLASQSNDTAKLCSALQQYSACMTPRIQGCKGPAKMAFDVITGKYASQPYNCKIVMGGETSFDLNGRPADETYQHSDHSDTVHDHHGTIAGTNTNVIDDDEARIIDGTKDSGEPINTVLSQRPVTIADDDQSSIQSSSNNQKKTTPSVNDNDNNNSPKSSTTDKVDKTPGGKTTTMSPELDPSEGGNGAKSLLLPCSFPHLFILAISIALILYRSTSTL